MTTADKIHLILTKERGKHTKTSVAEIINVSKEYVRQIVKRDNLEYLLKQFTYNVCPQCGGKKGGHTAKLCNACRKENTPRIIYTCDECGKLHQRKVSESERYRLHFCNRHCLGAFMGRAFGFAANPQNKRRL